VCCGFLGCSTGNVNPSKPHANTGYVDFYTDSDLQLSWEVKRTNETNGEMKTVFSEFSPVEGNILRVAAAPGSHQFSVWFINRVTEGPQTVTVPVESGKITPVHVTLTPAGSTSVDRKVYGLRPSAKGYGRGTKVVSDTTEILDIGAVPQPPLPYQTKEKVPYYAAPPK
jgi:hypothetical protein